MLNSKKMNHECQFTTMKPANSINLQSGIQVVPCIAKKFYLIMVFDKRLTFLAQPGENLGHSKKV